MRRLTIFAKGNLDLRDTLYAVRMGDKLVWNGINEVLRARYPDLTARVKHETFTRSDALLEAGGEVPPALLERNLALGAFPPESQFSRALFDTPADAYVLSIQPDLGNHMLRHAREGFVFCPSDIETWPRPDREWVRDSFIDTGLIDVAQSMRNFEEIIARIRSRRDAPILVYNVSSVVPGERIHSHEGMEEAFSTRIRRFNLALIELSARTGIAIVDVDAVVARGGADRLKYDALHLTGEGCKAVAEEVARVLEDLGVFQSAESRA